MINERGPLKVQANSEGQIVIPFNSNPEFGYVQVGQEVNQLDTNGFLRNSMRIGWIKGKVEELEEMNFSEGQVIPGLQIQISESLEPAYDGHQPKINPQTEMPFVTTDGEPIYRSSNVVTTQEYARTGDILIAGVTATVAAEQEV